MTQGLVPFKSSPRAGQQLESVVESVAHLGGGHRLQPRGSQFDRQRDAIEPTTHLFHRPRFIGRQRSGALCEQLHGGIDFQR